MSKDNMHTANFTVCQKNISNNLTTWNRFQGSKNDMIQILFSLSLPPQADFDTEALPNI